MATRRKPLLTRNDIATITAHARNKSFGTGMLKTPRLFIAPWSRTATHASYDVAVCGASAGIVDVPLFDTIKKVAAKPALRPTHIKALDAHARSNGYRSPLEHKDLLAQLLFENTKTGDKTYSIFINGIKCAPVDVSVGA